MREWTIGYAGMFCLGYFCCFQLEMAGFDLARILGCAIALLTIFCLAILRIVTVHGQKN